MGARPTEPLALRVTVATDFHLLRLGRDLLAVPRGHRGRVRARLRDRQLRSPVHGQGHGRDLRGLGRARLVEAAGSWIPVFWVAVGCDLLAAILALFVLKALVIKLTTSPVVQADVAGAPARGTVATRG